MNRASSLQTQKLLLASHALLWLQLLLQGQLQPLLAIALPTLMGLQLRFLRQRLPRHWLLTLTVGLLLAWGVSQALGPRSLSRVDPPSALRGCS